MRTYKRAHNQFSFRLSQSSKMKKTPIVRATQTQAFQTMMMKMMNQSKVSTCHPKGTSPHLLSTRFWSIAALDLKLSQFYSHLIIKAQRTICSSLRILSGIHMWTFRDLLSLRVTRFSVLWNALTLKRRSLRGEWLWIGILLWLPVFRVWWTNNCIRPQRLKGRLMSCIQLRS